MRSPLVRRSRGRSLGLAIAWTLALVLGATTASAVSAPQAAAATAVSGSRPKISDKTPRVGQTLSVSRGTWTPSSATFSYQWYLDSVAIEGADASTYTVLPTDLGHRLKVSVTGQAEGLTSLKRTSYSTYKVARGYFTKPPLTIDDTTPVVDQVLTATVGTWKPSPERVSYQWYKVSSSGKTYKLYGATAPTYTVPAAVKGYQLKVKIWASATGYYTRSVTSARTSKVVQHSFSSKPAPLITGTASLGSTLSADPGTWVPVADKLAYQWKRSGSVISGATGSTYTVTDADLGARVTVTVTATRSGYATAAVTSAAVTPLGPSSDLHVGTFNLSGMNNDSKASGDQAVWAKRMPRVVAQILGEQSDVVGLQEAYQGTTYPQYTQLRDALNDAGGTYQVTDLDKTTSAATRIIYNTSTVKLLTHGAYAYNAQTAGKTTRYLVWATFRQLSNGKEFFFADTHLDPYTTASKEAEWWELVKKIPQLNTGNLPVVSVGDFNASKFTSYTAQLLPAMKAAGFGDVMNQEYTVNPPKGIRAENVVNGWINSFNDFRRDVTQYAYETRRDKIGNGIDWIFATNSLRVKQWKVVIDFNPTTLQINGVIPSDHNMISAIIVL